MLMDVMAVEPRLAGVGSEDHNDARLRRRIAHTRDRESSLASGVIAPRVFAQPDHDIDAAVSQIQSVRVSLTAVADDRHPLPREAADIRVSIVKEFRHGFLRRCRRLAPTMAPP